MAEEETDSSPSPTVEPDAPASPEEDRSLGGWVRLLAEEVATDIGERIRRFAVDAGAASASASAAFFSQPDSARLAEKAGRSLRELRELAGLTIEELATAIDLEDKSLLTAVEDGTATLSFDLLLRLSAILARNDPIPFLIRFTRTYNPDLWRRFEGVGATKLPLQYEREREFVNIYRGDDRARSLSDEGFQRVLEFTRAAFALGLHYAAEKESGASSAPPPMPAPRPPGRRRSGDT
jgi:transcriptional regulator with XRE-family HTH domain